MLDEDDRHVGGQIADDGEDFVAFVFGHAGGGFVEQQHAGLAGEGHGDFEQALLAIGQDAGADESYDHAVIAGGPWAHRLLPDLPLETRAIFHTWHLVENRQLLRPERHPITLRRSGTDHSFATMSALDGTRVKFAPHFDYPRDIPDIDEMGRHVRLEWQRRSAELIEQLLPGVVPDPVEAQIYPESFTPDGHAVVGAFDDDARVIVMGGFSGHGFKLAPGFARAVVDLLESGQSPLLPPEVSPFRDFTRLVSIRDLVLDSEPS